LRLPLRSLQAPLLYQHWGQRLWLSAYRCIYWEEEQALILSDLHFGKTGHFRKEGIAVPQQLYWEDLQRLFAATQHFKPKRLIVVGDFFHSHFNKELDLFSKWRSDLPHLQIDLVMGNHDILGKAWYASQDITLHRDALLLGPFHFMHAPPQEVNEATLTYCFSGHIHPGIRIRGTGKQSLRFPCFYFTATHCILPAFGSFTGLKLVEANPGEKLFAIVAQEVIEMA